MWATMEKLRMNRGSMFGLSIVESPYVGCDKARFGPQAHRCAGPDTRCGARSSNLDQVPGAHRGDAACRGSNGWGIISRNSRPVESETAEPNRDNLA